MSQPFQMQSQIDNVNIFLTNLQTEIMESFISQDPSCEQCEDRWDYRGGGGGFSRLIRGGIVFEQAGVNFSHVIGEQLPMSSTANRQIPKQNRFTALGVSMVIHPVNPYVPTMHANIRAFFIESDEHEPIWWFGGGFDLTPYYGFADDCKHWHTVAKQACDPFGPEVYTRYKNWCDEYFYLKHRGEPRGIGGLFFDDLNEWPFEKCFSYMQSVGNAILPAYIPIVDKRKNTPYGERERQFQLYRRGRYVEFNLIYDRGTLFGLQSGGRTESILMSLPPTVRWEYCMKPEPGSAEEKLYTDFLHAKDWLTSEVV